MKKSHKKVSLSFFFASFWGEILIFTIANETVLEFRFFAFCVIVAFFRSKKFGSDDCTEAVSGVILVRTKIQSCDSLKCLGH